VAQASEEGCSRQEELSPPTPGKKGDAEEYREVAGTEERGESSSSYDYPRIEGWLLKMRQGKSSWLITRWERSYWVLREHILHGYETNDLTTEIAHVPLDGSQVQHEAGTGVLIITVPGQHGRDGGQTWQLKVEKESEAYVWVAVIMQSNKIREKSHADAAFKKKNEVGKREPRKQLETAGEDFDDYEL